jgi:dTMP kinase
VDSTLAYQGGGHGIPLDQLMPIQEFATAGLEPDLRILLDVPVEIGLLRRHADPSSVNRIDLASRAFHERVRNTFLELAAAHPTAWCIIDGRDDVASVALKMHTEVQTRVLKNFPLPRSGVMAGGSHGG